MLYSQLTALPSAVQDMRLHFRCEFEVSKEVGSESPINGLIELAQKWVLSKERGDSVGLYGSWFADTGNWRSASKHRVRIEVDRAMRESPKTDFWAMRYDHPDRDSNFRQWRTDLTLTATERASVVVSLQISHYLRPGHFGEEPLMPEPTSPLLVKNIFKAKGLVTYSGSQPLTARPLEVTPDDASSLVERINDPNRQCPLVYISREFKTGEPSVNASDLAWSLAGLAAVYVAESNWLDKATERLLPEDYRCWDGRIRVYLPNVRFDRPQDSRRHRYFTAEQIRQFGVSEIERIIVHSLARRVALSSATPVLNIDDVRLKKREQHFENLKSQLALAPSAEMLELLESINKDLEQGIRNRDAELETLRDQIDWQEVESQEKDDELRKSRYLAETMSADAKVERDKRIAMEARASTLSNLRNLPESLTDCCSLIANAFPDRIELTERALSSAEKSDFPKITEAYRALWHLANTLYDLVFHADHETGVDLEDEFRRQAGIKLALSEGKLTKSNSKLMQSRVQEHKGERIDIVPHLKLEAAGKYLRIYFHIHKERRVIVIGHCGDHLDTAGTIKRK